MRRILFALAIGAASGSLAATPPSPRSDIKTANQALVQGNYAQAAVQYTTLLTKPGLSPTAKEALYLSRAYAFLQLHRRAEGIADLRAALAINPDDIDAANALAALQGSPSASPGEVPINSVTTPRSTTWGPLVSLPGHYWLISTTKPIMYARYEWARVGVSMIYAGKDRVGNRIEGQYFLDPVTNSIRANGTYRGKTTLADVEVSEGQFVEIVKGSSRQRQSSQMQRDGTFDIVFQKPHGTAWQTVAMGTQVPTTEKMIASLGWPDEAPSQPSFFKQMGDSLKGGALEGLREGTREGVHDAVQDRIRRATKTRYPQGCRTISGEIVACP